jgi:ATP-binding cassette, subfamily B, bacterial
MSDLETAVWPRARLGEAMARLAGPRRRVEATFEDFTYAGAARLLRRRQPFICLLDGPTGPSCLAVLGARSGRVRVLPPDLRVLSVPEAAVRGLLLGDLERPAAAAVDSLLAAAGVPSERRPRARAAVLDERLGEEIAGRACLLDLSPGAPFAGQVLRSRLPFQLPAFIGAHAAQYALWLLSWWVAGRAVLAGRPDAGQLMLWAALLLALVPFRLLATWLEGAIGVEAGRLLRRRLMRGALKLQPDEIKMEGAGHLLGRVMESEAVESLAVTGGLLTLIAVLELVAVAVVLLFASPLHALLLMVWACVMLYLAFAYLRQRRAWTRARLAMTHDLVESMIGHRTRLVQLPPELWHGGEEEALHGYLGLSRRLDRSYTLLSAVVPRGWLLIGLVGLAAAGRASLALVAVVVGGLLLGFQAFNRLGAGVSHLAGAVVAWTEISLLFNAAGRAESIKPGAGEEGPAAPSPLVRAEGLGYDYPGRQRPALDGCTFTIERGDRLLLEGPSGSGKSTLAAVLAGLRMPARGSLELEGVARSRVESERWRQRVVLSPQFHENHVFLGPMAFNLLFGKRWPPRPDDLDAAERLLRELGLGDLLARMPAGLQQMVGETGWRMSHGEQSLLFAARAVLQGADLLLLDESFGALDPERLGQALAVTRERAPTLLVIVQ